MSDKIRVRPLAHRLVVKRTAAEERSKGGIIIPDNAKERPAEGTIIAAGPGKMLDSGKRREPEVKVGDRVLFGKYSGADAKVSGDEYLIINEDDVLAVIETE